jgi:cytochrome c553
MGIVLSTTLLALADVQSARASDIGVKLEYCMSCHGLSAEGYRGHLVMPRLAGQQPQYIEDQLRAFSERRRVDPVMANVSHGLTPEIVHELARRLRALDPPPFGGAPKASIALGRSIYETGLPDSNIPACSACHGSEGKGGGAIPRLAGQLYWYTVKSLSNWSREHPQGREKDIASIMAQTSHNLNSQQMSAIAAYVSTLK